MKNVIHTDEQVARAITEGLDGWERDNTGGGCLSWTYYYDSLKVMITDGNAGLPTEDEISMMIYYEGDGYCEPIEDGGVEVFNNIAEARRHLLWLVSTDFWIR